MDVKEAVKSKEQYSGIVTYYKNLKTLNTEQIAVLIDVIDEMSEEIFEHYKALQLRFKEAVTVMLEKRKQEGSFAFLTQEQKEQLSYAMEKAGRMGILLWEKYDWAYEELKKEI